MAALLNAAAIAIAYHEVHVVVQQRVFNGRKIGEIKNVEAIHKLGFSGSGHGRAQGRVQAGTTRSRGHDHRRHAVFTAGVRKGVHHVRFAKDGGAALGIVLVGVYHGVQMPGAVPPHALGHLPAQGFKGGHKGVGKAQAHGQAHAQEGHAVGLAQICAGGVFLRAEGGQFQRDARPGHEGYVFKGRAVLGQAVVGFLVAAVQILRKVWQQHVVEAARVQQGLERPRVGGGKMPRDDVDAAVGRGIHRHLAHHGVQCAEKAFVLRTAVAGRGHGYDGGLHVRVAFVKIPDDGGHVLANGFGQAGGGYADDLRLIQPDEVFQPLDEVFCAAEHRALFSQGG